MRDSRLLLVPVLLALVGLWSLSGCAAPAGKMQADTKGGEAREVEVPLSGIPAAVSKAAGERVPGLVIKHATRCTEDGKTLYDIEGVAGGVEYEMEVSADGTVLEVESEDDDACDDDENEHEDDDDEDHDEDAEGDDD